MPDGCLRVCSVLIPLTVWLKQDLVATLSHKGFLFNKSITTIRIVYSNNQLRFVKLATVRENKR